MTYWDIAVPVIQNVAFTLLILLLIASAVAGFIGFIGSFMSDYFRSGIPRLWWITAAILGILILTFGVPFSTWLHSEWYPQETSRSDLFPRIDTFKEAYQECHDEGNYWYAWRQGDNNELVWVCSTEELDIPQ